MKIKAYEAYFIQPLGRKLAIKKPPVYLTKNGLIDKVMWGKSFEFMYFVNTSAFDYLITSDIIHVSREEFERNPKCGILCYKNTKGKLSFKQFYKTTTN